MSERIQTKKKPFWKFIREKKKSRGLKRGKNGIFPWGATNNGGTSCAAGWDCGNGGPCMNLFQEESRDLPSRRVLVGGIRMNEGGVGLGSTYIMDYQLFLRNFLSLNNLLIEFYLDLNLKLLL